MVMNIDDIKIMTLKALMADDLLMSGLVLKGGNALHLAYDITNRGSVDIDFSMENEFLEKDFKRLKKIFSNLLNEEFNKVDYIVYDVNFIKKPKSGSIPQWKGYLLEFKLIELEKYEKFAADIDTIRRNSYKVNGQSTKYTVDISAYEYIDGARSQEIEGVILKVYTPEMILVEKIRAICQSMEEYKDIVSSAKQKIRTRDIYDIWKITNSFKRINLSIDLFKHIFEAKKVPIDFMRNIQNLREPYRSGWDSVLQTITPNEKLEEYDFYFDHLLTIIEPIISQSDNKDSIS